ncbi:MAG: OBAP family protein [Candidatus Loosdrechtia sp.]|uniref:OBAP family protein n=1 Tax=Candidatus Loosdrechtia sp. TaxID=3101272 RepID=UPI003A71F8A4|nr:MAG: OBAP family protein [Candidatus Jettenia sp. AMX2]
MLRYSYKNMVNKIVLVWFAMFFGLITMVTKSTAAEIEHDGVDNVSKLKYADPVKDIHLYLCAFHIAKTNPNLQIEAHHYCSMRNLTISGGDIHQCIIYDSKDAPAKLLGIEYIISDETYQKLPEQEKKYWHPHAYEIISGQLIVPDLPDMGDKALEGFMTSWGKTFHTWPDPNTEIPMGEPLLMWSAGADGQISKELIDKRDKQFGISTDELRERRKMYGYQVPDVDVPKSIEDIGRQWSGKGPDKPKKLKEKE